MSGSSDSLPLGRGAQLPPGHGDITLDTAALRESEQRFRQIAEAINHVFWVVDLRPVEHVSYVSPSFERVWGRSVQELYADARLWMQVIHEADRPAVAEAFEHWLHDPEHRSFAVEYRILRPDGEHRWIFDRGQAVRIPRGFEMVGSEVLIHKEGERLIVMKEGHCLGDQVLRFCDRRELHPNISFRSAQIETIQALVRAGLGLSLIPAMAAQSEGGGGPEYRSFSAPHPSRKIVAGWPQQRPPGRAAGEFLKMVSRRFGKTGR